MRLVVATGNPHKLAEVSAILSGADLELVPLTDFPHTEPVEDGVSFAENALIKARAAVAETGLAALADDSGIVVDVLGQAPGVFSARWSGRHGNDTANRDLLLAQLSEVPDQHRGARFVAAVAVVFPDGREIVEEGELKGTLLRQARGEGGFGYDPIFQPLGESRSTAEMSAEEKNRISHRGQALRKIAQRLAE